MVTEAIEGFVADIIRRSKDVETLIAVLPSKAGSGERVSLFLHHAFFIEWAGVPADLVLQAKRIEELQAEMTIANEEYKEVLAQAEGLLEELQAALDSALGEEPLKKGGAASSA
jgi:mediator of RNA polymerase II transcription subunit 21